MNAGFYNKYAQMFDDGIPLIPPAPQYEQHYLPPINDRSQSLQPQQMPRFGVNQPFLQQSIPSNLGPAGKGTSDSSYFSAQPSYIVNTAPQVKNKAAYLHNS